MTIVPGEGPIPARWCVVGERPGEDEARYLRPFIGKTGREQDRHLERGGLRRCDGYLTNLVKTYIEKNPAPASDEIAEWGPRLLAELADVRPKFIISAGNHATKFFLGDSAHLEAVHGVPHRWSAPGIPELTVIPTYHPAAHFYKPDLLQYIVYDYARACAVIQGRASVDPPVDQFPNPRYYDLNDSNADWYLGQLGGAFSMDTEGVPGAEWSIQVSVAPGTGLALRRSHPDFSRAAQELRRAVRLRRPVMVVHSALYDLEMCRGLGFDFMRDLDIPLFDTMMAAYLMCVEPQSMKMLAKRHCGMEMREYAEVVGKAGVEKQLGYLEEVMQREWPAPGERVERSNDGSTRLYRPQPVGRRAEAILGDYWAGKVDKEGNLADPLKRWRKVDRELRRMVEREMGRMPVGTLEDVPLTDAIAYSCRDVDATIRLYPKMKAALEGAGLTDLMAMKMRMIRAAASMKMTGVLGRRTAFEELSEKMVEEMEVIRGRISRLYFGGKDFNPMSSPQTATLMRMRGLVGEKRTAKGKMSTSKKSIEHLRHEDPAIEDIEQWRERSKVKDSFADPVLDNWPDDPAPELVRVKCDLKITRVSSGRFSAANLHDVPSAPLLAIPTRSDLGKSVRDCYEAEEGYVLASFDLDQAEMRIMADESGDERLIGLFNDGKIDIHTDTAAKIFGIPYAKVDKMLHRYPAKRVGFGVITGIQGKGLLDQLRMAGITGWTVKSCDRLIADWLKLHPQVPVYMQWCRDECRKNGGVIRDRWGMPRYLPAILDTSADGKWDRLEAERQTHSHRIQGGAQGWLQNVMGWLWEELEPYGDAVRFIQQIHDELMFEIAQGLGEEVGAIIKEGMISHGGARLKVPVKSSGSFATSWGKLKD